MPSLTQLWQLSPHLAWWQNQVHTTLLFSSWAGLRENTSSLSAWTKLPYIAVWETAESYFTIPQWCSCLKPSRSHSLLIMCSEVLCPPVALLGKVLSVLERSYSPLRLLIILGVNYEYSLYSTFLFQYKVTTSNNILYLAASQLWYRQTT